MVAGVAEHRQTVVAAVVVVKDSLRAGIADIAEHGVRDAGTARAVAFLSASFPVWQLREACPPRAGLDPLGGAFSVVRLTDAGVLAGYVVAGSSLTRTASRTACADTGDPGPALSEFVDAAVA